MNCEHGLGQCNIPNCATYLMGNKRQNKQHRQCYDNTEEKANRLPLIDFEIDILMHSKNPSWLCTNLVNELKREKAQIKRELQL